MTSSWRETQKEQLRERLYEAALSLFRSQSFEATKVAEITAAAGVSKGSFFNYFPAKEHLLREWYRRTTMQSLEDLRARSFATAYEAIMGIVSSLSAHATANADLYAMKERHAFTDGTMRREERELDGELVSFFMDHVEAGQRSGELGMEFDARLCVSVILSVLTGTAHEWVVADHGFNLEEVLAERIGFLLRAANFRSD